MCKIKKALEEIGEGIDENDSAEVRRRQKKWTDKIIPILRSLPEHVRKEKFDTVDIKAIWEEMNTAADHRQRVIEWLDSVIFSQVEGEIEGITKQMQAQKVQEAYRTTKSIAMKRYIDKKSMPQCDIDKGQVEEYFRETWAKPVTGFTEATEGSPLFLEPRIPGDADNEMEEFMMDESNIKKVINSRQDLSACGPDGISYRILKSAGEEGVKYMKILTKACIRCGRTMTT
jgi:hypothetical protein